ncbi:MAG: phosphatase PAP2 family protein, partial [Elusimicrobiota bacterium]
TICLITIFFSISTAFSTSSPFSFNTTRELQLVFGSSLLLSYGIYSQNNKASLDLNDIEKLNDDDVNSFDRITIRNWSLEISNVSDYAVAAYIIMPTLLLTKKEIKDNLIEMTTLYAETLLINNIINSLSKGLITRTRPYAYNPDVSIGKKTNKNTQNSFLSGHTSNAFASAFFLINTYNSYYPNSKMDIFLSSTILLGAAGIAYLRVESGMHYPTDVMAGAITGSITGFLILYIHKTKNARIRIASIYNSKNTGIDIQFIF